MPNQNTHFAISALVGIGTYLAFKRQDHVQPTLDGVISSGLLGGTIGLLPDLVEPARHPNHRQFFHSGAWLGLMALSGEKVNQNPNVALENKRLLWFALACYTSHLLADSNSQKGFH